MKHGYKQIGLDPKHEEVHRASFMQPETVYVSTTLPTVDNTKLGELKVYYDGTNYWLYTKLSKTIMGKTQWSGSTSGKKGCKIIQSTNMTIVSSTITPVVFDTIEFDTQNEADLPNNRIVVKEDGRYLIIVSKVWQGSNLGARREMIEKNGTSSITEDLRDGNIAAYGVYHFSNTCVTDIIAGDSVNVKTWQNSGGNLILYQTTLSVIKLS